jgi:hypothetical protein
MGRIRRPGESTQEEELRRLLALWQKGLGEEESLLLEILRLGRIPKSDELIAYLYGADPIAAPIRQHIVKDYILPRQPGQRKPIPMPFAEMRKLRQAVLEFEMARMKGVPYGRRLPEIAARFGVGEKALEKLVTLQRRTLRESIKALSGK